jgi:quercetin dioxygenase-like cupin family protein
MLVSRLRLFVRSLVPCTLVTACHPAAAPSRADTVVPAARSGAGQIRRTLVAQHDVVEWPGWETRIYVIEYPPGAAAPAHIHPAVGVGYVLEGRFESSFAGEAPTTVEAGHGFVDRAGAVHTLFRNPDPERTLRFVIAYTIRRGEPTLEVVG